MTMVGDAISHLDAAATILRQLQREQDTSGFKLTIHPLIGEEMHPLDPAVGNLSKKGTQLSAYVAKRGGIVDYHDALSDLELAGVCDSSRGLGGIVAGITRNRWGDLPPVLRLQTKGRNQWDIVMHPDYRELDWSVIAL
jgi:hypothetical protein